MGAGIPRAAAHRGALGALSTVDGMSQRTVAVVGGNGQIARLLHPLLIDRGHHPIALVRSDAQRADLEEIGAEVRILDIEQDDDERFATVLKGADVVVFAAGGGPDGSVARKRTVDLEGSTRASAAAQSVGIRRFVQVSAIDVDRPVPDDAPEVWKAYVAAKRDADASLRSSDLAWTIIRPGRLTDGAPTGQVALGPEVPREEVTRADVAAVLAEIVDTDAGVGVQVNLVGGEMPVAAAVAALETQAQSATDE